MATAGTFLETKLVFRCDKQRLKSLKYLNEICYD